MLGDVGEHVAQVGFRVDIVELGGANERVDRRGTLAARELGSIEKWKSRRPRPDGYGSSGVGGEDLDDGSEAERLDLPADAGTWSVAKNDRRLFRV